ncbi:hypothetical protein NDU88_012013 [Pleurodeles waltl]|uniref:Uncharacterized protein n=1 Tax=Pleurodeles waltl TaxID=8319 RepID=A0AAV7R3F3_PLEWA|nr:hypothetical protein NDU88_012013 [Pleurodeles waltl]
MRRRRYRPHDGSIMHSDSAADVAQSTTLPTPPSGQRAVKKHVEKQKMTNLSPQRTNKVKNSEFKLHRSPHRLTKRPSAPKSTRKRDRALTAQDLTLKARSLPATVKTTCASAPSSLRKASGECERHSSVLRPLSKRQNLDGDAEDARPRVAAGGSGSREQQSPWMQTARPHCALTVKIKRTRLKALDQEISNGLGESQRPLPTTNVNHKSGSPCRRNPLKKHLPTSTTQKQPQETVPQSSCSLLSPQSSLRNIQTAHMGNSPQLSDGSPVHMDCDSRESTNTESAVQLMGSLFITEERMASMDVSHTQEKNEDQYSQDNSTSEERNSNALSEKSQAEELNSLGAPSKTKEPTLEQPPGKYLTDACVLVEGSHNKNVLQNEEQQDTDVAPSTHNRTTFVEDTALVLKHKENCKQGEGEKPTTQNMCAEIKLKEEGSSTQIAFTDMQKLQDQCDQPCTQKINSQAKEQRTMESNSSITPRGTQDQGGKGYGPISETMLSNVVHRDNDEKLSSRRGPKEVDRQSNQGNLAKDVPEGIPKILLTEEDADED